MRIFPAHLSMLFLPTLMAGCDGPVPTQSLKSEGKAAVERPGAAGPLLTKPPLENPAAPACGTAKGSIPASDPCIQYLGRFDFTDPAEPVFDWPGVAIEARFQGTSVKARLEATGAYFDAYVDGVKVFPQTAAHLGKASLLVEAGDGEFMLAKGLAAGEHVVRIEKRSETNWNACGFTGFTLDAGMGLAVPPPRPERRIEFIGDSYTVGFGNESPAKSSVAKQDSTGRVCSDTELPAFTNTQATYAVLAAKSLDADYQVNAYSGLGMARHYNGSTAFLPFQDYYRRTLNSNAASPAWDPARWIPGVVLIALGTNDFSTPLNAGEAYATRADLYTAYQAKYRDFLALLRQRYPGVKFILTATNLWPEDEMKVQVKKVIENEKALGHNDATYFEFINTTGYGCAWHPDIATHLTGSRNLARRITEVTGWTPSATGIVGR